MNVYIKDSYHRLMSKKINKETTESFSNYLSQTDCKWNEPIFEFVYYLSQTESTSAPKNKNKKTSRKYKS